MQMKVSNGFVIALLLLFTIGACGKERNDEISDVPELEGQVACELLNHFVGCWSDLISEWGNDAFILENWTQTEDSVLTLKFSDQMLVEIADLNWLRNTLIPKISISQENGSYYWNLDSQWIVNSSGGRCMVGDGFVPMFSVDSLGKWNLSTDDGNNWIPLANEQCAKGVDVISMLQNDNGFFTINFKKGYSFVFPTRQAFESLPHNVQNTSYYKDVFLDAGVYLTTRSFLYSVNALGYQLECVSCTDVQDTLWQNMVIGGNEEDENGRLLYPDGQPRFRVLFVNGGNSRYHGKSLGPKSRERMRNFVLNGGSYVGTCAGACLPANGYDTHPNYEYYLNLWPANTQHTGLIGTHTGMFIEPNSPLLNYYTFGGDAYVANIRHNKGSYPQSLPLGTEVLARYDYPSDTSVHRKPSIWAYKPMEKSGRIVMEGSHPEEVKRGECLELTAAMIRYAEDGRGYVSVKDFLKNGVAREMNCSSSENNPAYTKIGDLQCHYFALYIPFAYTPVRLKVSGPDNCHLNVMVSKDSYATSQNAMYSDLSMAGSKDLPFLAYVPGVWYVTVQCMTTVTSRNVDLGQEYSGRTDVLNGVPYTIVAEW